MAQNLTYTEHKYGENDRQRLGVWEFPPISASSSEDDDKPHYWLVYIHGGAWRDPREDVHGIETTIDALHSLAPGVPPPRERFAGFASIDYRLSPHPDFPQDRDRTPAWELRDARHPDHVKDVSAALSLLAEIRPGSLSRYILFGHSCGAFLAFQLLMRDPSSSLQETYLGSSPQPAVVVGFQGIYDLRGLNSRKGGAYTELFEVPFGPDRAVWDSASPALYRGGFGRGAEDDTSGEEAARSEEKRLLAVVAHSPEDELVDVAEQVAMERALRENGVQYLSFTDLKGTHSEVRDDGKGIARVLLQTLATLDELESLLFGGA